MTRALPIVMIAVVAVLAGGCSVDGNDSDKAGGEERPDALVLTLANHEGGAYDVDEFATQLARRSGGSLRVEVRDNWRGSDPDYERHTLEDVRSGKVDLGKLSARAFDLAGVTSLQPLVAPFAVDSHALQRRVLESGLAPKMLRGVERAGVVGIALLPGDLRRPVGVERALVEPSAFAGATIATRPSALGESALRALGAHPEPVLPDADSSPYDGAELSVAGVQSDAYDGPPRTLAANVVLWPRALGIVMNSEAYERLTAEQREQLRAAGRAALEPALRRIVRRERESLAILCRRGDVTFTSADGGQLAALRAAVAPLNRELEDAAVSREIAVMRAETPSEAPLRCQGGERGSGGAGGRQTTPLDGVWRTVTTEEDLIAAGAPGGEVTPENWGEWIFVFSGGRFAFTQRNSRACTFGSGTYAIREGVWEWTFEDGGGMAPTGAVNQPGEFMRFRWSNFRDKLRLRPVEGAISPAPFRARPWSKLDAGPARGVLHEDCLPARDALAR